MISVDLVIPAVIASSKKQLFRVIAESCALPFGITADKLTAALLEREKIGTTGIGDGVAVPHIKIQGLARIHTVLARLDRAIDYDAIDQKPVDIVFMILAPAESKTTLHLKMLAQASRFLKDAKFRQIIRENRDANVLETLVQQWSAEQDVRESLA
jgi:PTS system nitrogen regulatory IIA component